MECNKEEAIRAKEIAVRKMQNGDFVGARRIGMKAQQLYPDLENISQLLMVCEVHCSAQNKLNGSEMDWYGILQIERFSDELVVKKQFRKLALSLHPDKNKFAGAEAAFKLIGEANRVLTDPSKRSLYDMKCRGAPRSVAPKPAADQSNQNSFAKKQHGAANKFSYASHSQYTNQHTYYQAQQPTFWTCCPYCNMRYQYFREFRKKMLRCQNCQQPFMANDLGIPAGSSQSQFLNDNGVPNQGFSRFVPLDNSAKRSGMSSPHMFPESSSMTKVGKSADVDGSFPPNVVKVGAAGDSKLQERVNGHVDVKAGIRVHPVSMPDLVKTKGLKMPRSASDKRSKKTVKRSSENFDKRKNGSGEENVGIKQSGPDLSAQNCGPADGHPSRRSLRQKQHISYEENLSSDDDFAAPPPKRSKGNSLPSATAQEIKQANVSDRLSEADVYAGFSNAVLNGDSKEGKRKASPTHKYRPSSKKSKTGGSNAEGEVASALGKAGSKLESNDEKSKIDIDELNSGAIKPDFFVCPDPDFSNFEGERSENSFVFNQVWAVYDTIDGMPRYYARIKKVMTPGFKLRITWLEASPKNEAEQQWLESDLPIACGRYENGDTIETEDRLMFSHQIHCMNGRHGGGWSVYFIYPKRGETWALFKDWDMEWNSEPEKHQPPYDYEFVEILTDFSDDVGIGVAYLGKVKGFISIFQRVCCNDVLSFRIQPNELYRFSHRIPSFKMTGEEGEGVPAGSFELDTAALPSNFSNLVGSNGIGTPKNLGSGAEHGTPTLGRSPRESNGRCKDANDAGVGQQAKGEDGDNVASHGKLSQPEVQANERFSTHRKLKNKFTVDASTPRRSPRDLSNSSQLNAGQSTAEDMNEHAATNKDDAGVGEQAKEEDGCNVTSHGKLAQPEGTSGFQADEKRSTHKKLEKTKCKVDALIPRRSPRDLSKQSSQLNTGQAAAEDTNEHTASIKKDRHGELEKNKCKVDALTPRRSPRDLSKQSSQLNAGQSAAEDTNEHAASLKDDGHGKLGVSSRQPVDKMHFHAKDEISPSPKKGQKSTGSRVIEVQPCDFKKEKTEDKFHVNQIWALQSDNDGLPRNYAQVKKIESAVGFKLHVAILEADSLRKDTMQPASCGKFKVKNGKPLVFPASKFSHQVKAKMVGKNRYEIYPRQGEVWAVYRGKTGLIGECDIVEVVEDNDSGVKVVVLKRVNGLEAFFMPPRRLEKSIMEIPRADFGRFSHQCLASLHKGERESRLKSLWQLDPSSIPGSVILVD